MSTPTTSPSSARARLLAFVLGLLALVTLVACQMCLPASTSTAPAPWGSTSAAPLPDDLEQLSQALDQATTVLNFTSVACVWSSDPGACFDTLAGLEDAVTVAQAVIASAQTCRTSSAQGCLADAAATARSKLPELRRLTTLAQELQPRRLADDDPLVTGAAGGAGAAGASGAGGSR